MTAGLPATLVVRDSYLVGAAQFGLEEVFNIEYNANCEPDWRPFVEAMREANVEVFQFVGEPECFTALEKAMDTVGWYPTYTLLEANFYDTKYVAEAGPYAVDTYVRSQIFPFELAAENKATQDYLDLMARYNPDGKVAALGAQGISAWLLFAQAATECGSDLTRLCLLEHAQAVTEWTAGGLHPATNPSANASADCFLALKVGAEGFTYDEAFTSPNEGRYNCDPANVGAVG
jgi:hypothetical protein